MGGPAVYIWLFLAAGLFILEGLSVQLICIWFAVGSLFAMLAAVVGAEIWLQLLICLVTSISVLIVGRPLLLDRVTPRKQPTNADRVVGMLGVVQEEIDNLRQTGRVLANGLDWSARSEFGEVLPVGATVVVRRIDGVKLIVQPLPGENYQPVAQLGQPPQEAVPGGTAQPAQGQTPAPGQGGPNPDLNQDIYSAPRDWTAPSVQPGEPAPPRQPAPNQEPPVE